MLDLMLTMNEARDRGITYAKAAVAECPDEDAGALARGFADGFTAARQQPFTDDMVSMGARATHEAERLMSGPGLPKWDDLPLPERVLRLARARLTLSAALGGGE